MKIYADILVLINIYIDYFLILAVRRFFHLWAKPWRMVLGAVFGGFCGLLGLVPMPFYLSLFVLFLCGGLICLIAFYDGSKIMYIKEAACFFTFSMIFSGFTLALVELFGINASVVHGFVYFDISPVILIVFTLISYIVSNLLGRLTGRHTGKTDFVRIIVENNSAKTELFAKIDTGHSLKEPFSGTPVIVAERRIAEKIIPEEIGDYLDHKKAAGAFRLVPFSSVGGGGLLPAFKPSCIYFKESGKYINCFLAVYDGELNLSGINALISQETAEQNEGGISFDKAS